MTKLSYLVTEKEIKRELKQFRLGNLSERIPDSKLKHIIGGYEPGNLPNIPCFITVEAGQLACATLPSFTNCTIGQMSYGYCKPIISGISFNCVCAM